MKENPNHKLLWSFPEHDLTMQPQVMLERLETKAPMAIMDELLASSKKWSQTKIPKEKQKTLMENMNKRLAKSNQIFIQRVLDDEVFATDLSVQEFCKLFDQKLISWGYNIAAKQFFLQILAETIVNDADMAKDYPSPFIVGDTNWENSSGFGFAADPLSGGIVPCAFNPDTKAILFFYSLHERPWSFPKIYSLSDEFNLKMSKVGEVV